MTTAARPSPSYAALLGAPDAGVVAGWRARRTMKQHAMPNETSCSLHCRELQPLTAGCSKLGHTAPRRACRRRQRNPGWQCAKTVGGQHAFGIRASSGLAVPTWTLFAVPRQSSRPDRSPTRLSSATGTSQPSLPLPTQRGTPTAPPRHWYRSWQQPYHPRRRRPAARSPWRPPSSPSPSTGCPTRPPTPASTWHRLRVCTRSTAWM